MIRLFEHRKLGEWGKRQLSLSHSMTLRQVDRIKKIQIADPYVLVRVDYQMIGHCVSPRGLGAEAGLPLWPKVSPPFRTGWGDWNDFQGSGAPPSLALQLEEAALLTVGVFGRTSRIWSYQSPKATENM